MLRRRFASLGAAITILSLAYGVVTQQLISLRTEVAETLASGPAGEVPRASFVTQEGVAGAEHASEYLLI